MRKLFIIALFSIHLFGNTEFSQLLHLPYLVAHYLHHQHNDQSIGFADFVAEHYGKGDKDPTDDKEEKEMPFMQAHQHLVTICTFPVDESLITSSTTFPVQKKTEQFISIELPVGFFCADLKPPRAIT